MPRALRCSTLQDELLQKGHQDHHLNPHAEGWSLGILNSPQGLQQTSNNLETFLLALCAADTGLKDLPDSNTTLEGCCTCHNISLANVVCKYRGFEPPILLAASSPPWPASAAHACACAAADGQCCGRSPPQGQSPAEAAGQRTWPAGPAQGCAAGAGVPAEEQSRWTEFTSMSRGPREREDQFCLGSTQQQQQMLLQSGWQSRWALTPDRSWEKQELSHQTGTATFVDFGAKMHC